MTPKVLISFTVIVIVLAVPSLIWVICPTCHGAGRISTMPGVENLRIRSVVGELLYRWENPCGGGTIRYGYNVTLENVGSNPVQGIMEIIARDPQTGLNVTKRLAYVEVSAETPKYVFSGIIVHVVPGGAVRYVPSDFNLLAYFPSKEVTCPSCYGRGEVSLLQWPIVYIFGGAKPVGPPIEIPIPEKKPV